MPFNTPNVYTEEQSGLLPSSISDAETVPAFIGYTETGLLNTPTRITSLLEYEETFGGARDAEGLSVTVQDNDDSQTVKVNGTSSLLYDSLYYQVQLFFANGGGACYIVSVAIQSSSQIKLIADDGVSQDNFGGAFASSNENNRLLIGSKRDSVPGPGGVYIFERQSDEVTWTQVERLIPQTATSGIRFGVSVALSRDGTTALVGEDGDLGGSAFVFVHQPDGSWLQEAKIERSGTSGKFGTSVALTDDGNTALIGDFQASRVYTYERQNGNWSETTNFTGDDTASSYQFGEVLVISGDGTLAIVSGYSSTLNSGATYVFERQSDGTWIQVSKFSSGDEIPAAVFGFSIALSGNTVLIGQYDIEEETPGRAYIYERQADGVTWSQQALLIAADGHDADGFGYSVALCDDVAVVGAYSNDEKANRAGAAYLFKRHTDNATWVQVDKIIAADGQPSDYLGAATAVFGNTVVVGATSADGLVSGSGAAYLLELEGPTLSNYQAALDSLADEEEPELLVFPNAANELCSDDQYTLYKAALAQAGSLKDRFVIMDTADSLSDAGDRFREGIGDSNLDYGAVYYPFIETTLPMRYNDATVTISHVQSDGVTASTYNGYNLADLQTVNDLLYNDVKLKLNNLGMTLPASGAMAGVYARVDYEKGVWHAPANTPLMNVSEPTVKLSNADQEAFNVDDVAGKSINVIRSFNGFGTLVWGGRTLDGNDYDWRYVNTKRLLIKIEKDLQTLAVELIGETNVSRNHTKLKGIMESYLIDLWEKGALAGSSAEEAFFVDIGLGETMTEDDISNGVLKISAGVAATRPAEFVLITFTQS